MNDVRDQIQAELGEHGAAWRAVYDAHLRDPEALRGVASACGAFGAIQYVMQLRADGGIGELRPASAAHRNMERLAAALAAPVEPVVQQLKDVSDRPLFTGIPESIKQ